MLKFIEEFMWAAFKILLKEFFLVLCKAQFVLTILLLKLKKSFDGLKSFQSKTFVKVLIVKLLIVDNVYNWIGLKIKIVTKFTCTTLSNPVNVMSKSEENCEIINYGNDLLSRRQSYVWNFIESC